MTDKEILIQKGKTFSLVVRWETEPIVRKAITAISLATGAPRLTISSHGITDGWNGTVYGVEGMKQINDVGVQQLTVIDSNTIELNGVTPIDDNGKMWSAYTSGGFVKFYTPKSLSGYTARMDIKDKIGGTVWASSEIADTPYDIIDIALDDVAKTITLTIDAVDTVALTASSEGVRQFAYYDPPGILTVCYGHTGSDVKKGVKYSLDECKALLSKDMLAAMEAVDRCHPDLPVPVLAAFGDANNNDARRS